MNYYEILFLILIGVVIPSNCLGCYCLIVLGGNKHYSGEVHYPGGNYSGIHIILHSLSANCPRANYLGDNFQGSNVRGAVIPGGNCPVPCFVCSCFIFLKVLFQF